MHTDPYIVTSAAAIARSEAERLWQHAGTMANILPTLPTTGTLQFDTSQEIRRIENTAQDLDALARDLDRHAEGLCVRGARRARFTPTQYALMTAAALGVLGIALQLYRRRR